MKSGIRVPQPYLILWGSGVALSCNLEGAALAEELHGLFAARLAMAELLAVQGEQAKAERLRQAAHTLRDIVEERYWMEEEGFFQPLSGSDVHSACVSPLSSACSTRWPLKASVLVAKKFPADDAFGMAMSFGLCACQKILRWLIRAMFQIVSPNAILIHGKMLIFPMLELVRRTSCGLTCG